MKERRERYLAENPEAYWETQEQVDRVTEREDLGNPGRKSRRKQLIDIQEALGYEAKPVEIGKLLGLTEDQAKRYLSRRGIRNEEFEEIKDVLTNYHTIALMLKRLRPHPMAIPDRRAILANTNEFLIRTTGIDAIKNRRPEMIVAQLEASFNFQDVEHPDFI